MITAALSFIHARKWLVELILLAAVVGGVWYWHHAIFEAGIQHQKDEDAKELNRVIAEAHAHETKIAKEASDAYEQKLVDIRNSPAIGPVRLCRTPRPVPAASPATGQSDAPPGGRVEGAVAEDPGPVAGDDIGPALDSYGGDCAAVGARLEALQRWVRAR